MVQMQLQLKQLDELQIAQCVQALRDARYIVKQRRRNLISGPKMYLQVIGPKSSFGIKSSNSNHARNIINKYFVTFLTSGTWNEDGFNAIFALDEVK